MNPGLWRAWAHVSLVFRSLPGLHVTGEEGVDGAWGSRLGVTRLVALVSYWPGHKGRVFLYWPRSALAGALRLQRKELSL